jgi:long-chain fatty acid transport protein
MGTFSGTSQHDVFVIPAMGVTTPINDQWRFGLGAYGISGLGVDYRNKGWDLDPSRPGAEGDVYTKLEIMKFAGMVSYNLNENFALGLALNGTYNNLDLGSGGSHDYAFGAQLGALYAMDMWYFGASYTSPEKASHERVADFDGNGSLDTLDLEAPHAFIAGVACEPNDMFLVEFDTKYYTWSSSDGYGDFDWDDQWVFALGAQYRPNVKWAVRAGYNYGKNPVKEHNGWNPMGTVNLQGKTVSEFQYEYLRTIGFPAVVEHHLTLGVGYQLTETIRMDLGYLHAFAKKFSNASMGNAINLESELSENSYSFSLSFAF